MANCQFPKELGLVSGTLSKKVIRTADGTITQRIVAQVRNGKQKIYLRTDKPRSTKISEAEILNRRAFKQACKEWKEMPESVRNMWQNQYATSPNRKQYRNLRGYVIASIMKSYKSHPDDLESPVTHNP